MTRIAIIGAGLSGLCLAQRLQSTGADTEVTVFEKGRGVGGRMATRRIDGWHFDHGAQFFTARHPAFRRFLAPYLDSGLVQQWRPKLAGLTPGAPSYRCGWFEPHYVAVPTMTSLAKSLAAPLAVVLQHEVKRLQRVGDEWLLHFSNGQISEPFDWVITALPAPMAVSVLPHDFRGHDAMRRVRYAPRATLMLGFHGELALPWDAAKVHDDTLAWVVRGGSRPGRPGPETLFLQSTTNWALEHGDLTIDEASARLEAALRALPGLADLSEAACRYVHRWRYGELIRRADAPAYIDPDLQLAACGEWGEIGSLESCYLSAFALHNQLELLRSGLRPAARQSMPDTTLGRDAVAPPPPDEDAASTHPRQTARCAAQPLQ
jgi:predicted NAD/FAD-dependent oxidoreductase